MKIEVMGKVIGQNHRPKIKRRSLITQMKNWHFPIKHGVELSLHVLDSCDCHGLISTKLLLRPHSIARRQIWQNRGGRGIGGKRIDPNGGDRRDPIAARPIPPREPARSRLARNTHEEGVSSGHARSRPKLETHIENTPTRATTYDRARPIVQRKIQIQSTPWFFSMHIYMYISKRSISIDAPRRTPPLPEDARTQRTIAPPRASPRRRESRHGFFRRILR